MIWKSLGSASGEASASDITELRVTSINDQQMSHGFGQGHGFKQAFDVNTGKLTYTIDGYFKDSLLEGQGTLMTSGGLRYVGSFHLGGKDGYGIMQFPKGNRYEGEFRNGSWEGHGLLTWGQGNSYVGDFHLGLPNGSGKLTDVGSGNKDDPQRILDGEWQRGCFVDHARYGCIQITRS